MGAIGFSFGNGILPGNPSTPKIGTPTIVPSFDGSDWTSIVQTAVADGLKVYSTVAANQIAGQQVSQGQQPTALFIPQQYAVNPQTGAAAGAGLLSTFAPGTWLLIGIVVFVLFMLKK